VCAGTLIQVYGHLRNWAQGELTQGQVADLEALEQDLDKVEAALVAAQTSLAATSGSGTGAANSGAGGAAAAAEIAQAVSRVERTAQRAAQLLHPRHIVLARAHTLLVGVCPHASQRTCACWLLSQQLVLILGPCFLCLALLKAQGLAATGTAHNTAQLYFCKAASSVCLISTSWTSR